MIDLRALVERRQGFLFLPLVYRLAARLEQMSWQELAEDPTASTYALRAAQKLFQLPAVVTHFRIGIEAEACGADLSREPSGDWMRPAKLAEPDAVAGKLVERPPLAQALEVTRRLSEELRGTAGTVGVLTGPRTLRSLFTAPPSDSGQIYATLARAYAERGVELLLVVEDPRVEASGTSGETSLAPLFNVARYFRVPTLLLDHASARPAAGFSLTLGGTGDPLLPLRALDEPAGEASRWRVEGRPVLATEWEVPPQLPAEKLTAWTRALAEASRPGGPARGSG